MGYWLPLTDLRDMAREAVEEDNADEDGFTGGAVSYRFLNANTVESFTTNCYIVRCVSYGNCFRKDGVFRGGKCEDLHLCA